MDWRQILGFVADAKPSFELAHDHYRERLNMSVHDQAAVTALGRALEQARKEILAMQIDDDCIHPEQLLPP